ncbi:MAG: Peptidase serralysin terminal [Actinomycetota bacterium]
MKLRGVAALGVIVLITSTAVPAYAVTSSGTDPSDAPVGPEGKTDLRLVKWNVGASTTTATIGVDASTYGAGNRATLGVHLLVDNDRDGIADAEVTAARNADGVSVDMTLRSLDRTLSTASCQDLSGKTLQGPTTVNPTVANGRETFATTFANDAVPGALAHFRWAAFGQSPGATSATGPWDYQPNATNPDPSAANPGDRRCDASKSGVAVSMASGVEVDTTNAAPTAAVKNGQCSASNTRSALVNVTVSDKDGDALVFTLTSNSNPALVPSANVAVGGSGNNRTVTFTAAANKAGRTALGFTVSDGKAAGHLVVTVIVGTINTETITGTAGPDVVVGLGGRNTINGNTGNDLLCGDAAADVLNGGGGNDTLTGRGSGDKFSGGPGTDVVTDFNASAGDTKDATIP